MGTRVFIPFGEFLPDRKLFGNEGLLRAFGVTPISGSYLRAPSVRHRLTTTFGSTNLSTGIQFNVYGFGLQQVIASGSPKIFAYAGGPTTIKELDVAADTLTDRSRASGYAFSSAPPNIYELWWFTSYGDNVIATNFEDEVQFLATPGSGLFADMITSTFKPQARFAFPIRQNLFLAYCFLPATFDGVASGTHSQFVCWSQNDNIQVFGSENVDPTHVGAGYQQFVGGDLGPITAAIGGDFGIVFHAGGITRIDGPPYEFRSIVRGDTTIFPYSVFRLGDDVYFWGYGGPSVLVGGEPPVRRLLKGKAERSLLDNVTGFGSDFAMEPDLGIRHVSGAIDSVNEIARWSFVPKAGSYLSLGATALNNGEPVYAGAVLDVDLRAGRLTVSPADYGSAQDYAEHLFLRHLPATIQQSWGPMNQIRFVSREASSQVVEEYGAYEQESADSDREIDMEFRTAFGRLSETHTSKIVAVRPIWSNKEGLAADIEGVAEVTVHTKNKPWEDETDSSVHAAFNEDGWIGTDTAVIGTYHSVTFKFKGRDSVAAPVPELSSIHEIEGLEIEFVEGAQYGA